MKRPLRFPTLARAPGRGPLLACLLACLLAPARGIAGDDELDQDQVREAVRSGLAMSYASVQARVRALCDCQILETKLEREHEDGRRFLVYEIKAFRADGRIVKLELEAANGRVLKMKDKGRKD